MATRRSGACVRCACLVMLAVTSALCVSGPALYWRYKKSLSDPDSSLSWIPGFGSRSGFTGFRWGSGLKCAACACDCPGPVSLDSVSPGLANLSITDCGKHDPELRKELEKQLVDLLTEELKLQETVASSRGWHANTTLADARGLAAQFQREAEKCNAATEACEAARERAEAEEAKERKRTEVWERRARQLGWRE